MPSVPVDLNMAFLVHCPPCGHKHRMTNQPCPECNGRGGWTPQPVSTAVYNKCGADYACDGCQAFRAHLR